MRYFWYIVNILFALIGCLVILGAISDWISSGIIPIPSIFFGIILILPLFLLLKGYRFKKESKNMVFNLKKSSIKTPIINKNCIEKDTIKINKIENYKLSLQEIRNYKKSCNESGEFYILCPNTHFPLTLFNVPDINYFIDLCFKAIKDSKKYKYQLYYLFENYDISCQEIDNFIIELKAFIEEKINKWKEENKEWYYLSDLDKEELINEYKIKAIEKYDKRPGDIESLLILIEEKPKKNIHKDFFKFFQNNIELFEFYINQLERKGCDNLFKITYSPDDNYFKEKWEKLVNLGLAKKGENIDKKILANDLLRMKDINEMFADRLDKPFRKKADAVLFAIKQEDFIAKLKEIFPLTIFYILVIPKGYEDKLEEIINSHLYYKEYVDIFLLTYEALVDVIETINNAKKAEIDYWYISNDMYYSSCKFCLSRIDKEFKKLKSEIPPFHIGCSCRLNFEGTYKITINFKDE